MDKEYLLQMPMIEIKTIIGTKFIKPYEIIFVQAKNKHALVYLKSIGYLPTCHPLKWYNQKLIKPYFFRCHNSFIINCYYFDSICNNELILNKNIRVPISRNQKKHFKENLDIMYMKLIMNNEMPVTQ
jgi:two-component system LytT family response regulator